jgi:hypothetical protein
MLRFQELPSSKRFLNRLSRAFMASMSRPTPMKTRPSQAHVGLAHVNLGHQPQQADAQPSQGEVAELILPAARH